MIPRTEIEAIEIGSSMKTLRDKFIETRLSRILVYRDTIDHIQDILSLRTFSGIFRILNRV